jgi:DNA polymerase-3 subunit delta
VSASAAAAPGARAPAGKESPVYLLLGPEEGEKAAFIEKIKQGLTAHLGQTPELTRFYAGDARMAEVVQCLSNKTLFAGHRLVIVSNAEQIKGAEEVGPLVEYMKSPAPDATLILVSPGLTGEIDRKLTGDPKKKGGGAIPFADQKIFWEMFENQKQGWVTAFFRQKKITIAPEAVEYILDMVENNTRDMRVECDRLAQFFGPDAVIGLESVEQYIYHSKEENVFTLFDKICERSLAGSAEVLDKILLSREAEAVQITSGLLLQFRRLASLKRMLAENYETAEAFPKLRIFSKKNQKTYVEGNRRYSAHEVQAVVQLLAEFDVRFRSVKGELHELLLHLLVYYIVQRAGQGAWRQSL